MRNFIGKILFLFLFLGCDNICLNDKNDYIKILDNLIKIKDDVTNKYHEDYLEINYNSLNELIGIENFKNLNELGLVKIIKIKGSIVFSFKKVYEKNWIENKLESKINSCEYHVVYLNNEKEKQEIISLEQYADCRIKNEEINDKWIIIYQFSDCN